MNSYQNSNILPQYNFEGFLRKVLFTYLAVGKLRQIFIERKGDSIS